MKNQEGQICRVGSELHSFRIGEKKDFFVVKFFFCCQLHSCCHRGATHSKTARGTHHDGHKLHDVVGEEEFVEHCSDEKGVLVGDWKKRFPDKEVLGTSVMADVLYRLLTQSDDFH